MTNGGANLVERLVANSHAVGKRQKAGALQEAGALAGRLQFREASWSACGPPPLLARQTATSLAACVANPSGAAIRHS